MYTLKQFNRGEERRFKRKLISDTDLAIRNIQLSPIEETARYSYTRALDEYNAVLINRLARMQPPPIITTKVGKVERVFYPSLVSKFVLSNSFYPDSGPLVKHSRQILSKVCIVLGEDSFRYPL